MTDYEKCTACRGRGTVAGPNEYEVVQCGECMGTGEIDASRPCTRCRKWWYAECGTTTECCGQNIRGTRTVIYSWQLGDALFFISNLNPLVKDAGWCLGLTGSVLIDECSDNDLDLIAYPFNNAMVDREKLYQALGRAGMVQAHDLAAVHGFWKRGTKGALDGKHVEVWITHDGKRVDLFILG